MGLSVLISLLCVQKLELYIKYRHSSICRRGLSWIFLLLLSDDLYSLFLLWKDKLAFCKRQIFV